MPPDKFEPGPITAKGRNEAKERTKRWIESEEGKVHPDSREDKTSKEDR